MTHQTVYVIDFGGQYTQLIVRRVREQGYGFRTLIHEVVASQVFQTK